MGGVRFLVVLLVASRAWASSVIGCGDGTREYFANLTKFPYIAGCRGRFDGQGVNAYTETDCDRRAGNNGDKSDGGSCSALDLCAYGWHICQSYLEVKALAGSNPCAQATEFFATLQSSDSGGGNCMASNSGWNDLYGCGSNSTGYSVSSCGVLNAGLSTSSCPTGWECGSSSSREAKYARVSQSVGGVLCCKNGQFANIVADDSNTGDSSMITSSLRSDYVPGFFSEFALSSNYSNEAGEADDDGLSGVSSSICALQNCSQILSSVTLAKVGRNPQCEFSSNCMRLDVYFGPDSTIQVNDTIGYTFTSLNSSLASPSNPPSIVPVISSPVFFSTCSNEFMLSGSQSLGLYSRGDNLFTWRIRARNSSGTVLLDKVLAVNSTLPNYVLKTEDFSSLKALQLIDPLTVNLELKIQNFLGQASSVSTEFPFYADSVSIDSNIESTGSNLIISVSLFSKNNCSLTLKNPIFTLKSLNGTADLSDYISNLENPPFAIPTRLFDPSLGPYFFQVSLYSEDSNLNLTLNLPPVVIPLPEFFCGFSSGDLAELPSTSDVVLDLYVLPRRQSFQDFDLSISLTLSCTPVNSCTEDYISITRPFLDGIQAWELFISKSAIQNVTELFLESTVFFKSLVHGNFTVSTYCHSQIKRVQEIDDAPHVKIEPLHFRGSQDSAFIYSSNDLLRLSAKTEENELGTDPSFNWSCATENFEIDLTSSDVLLSSPSSNFLSISLNALVNKFPALSKFFCSVSPVYGSAQVSSSSSQITILIAKPPALSTITVDFIAELRCVGFFSISVSGFYSNYNPLYFSFIAENSFTGELLILRSKIMSSAIISQIPTGTWKIFALVTDSLGGESKSESEYIEVSHTDCDINELCEVSRLLELASEKATQLDFSGSLLEIQAVAHILIENEASLNCAGGKTAVHVVMIEILEAISKITDLGVQLEPYKESLVLLSRSLDFSEEALLLRALDLFKSFSQSVLSQAIESETFFRLEFKVDWALQILEVIDLLHSEVSQADPKLICQGVEETYLKSEELLSLASSKMVPGEAPVVFNGLRFFAVIIPASHPSHVESGLQHLNLNQSFCNQSDLKLNVTETALFLASSHSECANQFSITNFHSFLYCNRSIYGECFGSAETTFEDPNTSLFSVFAASFLSNPFLNSISKDIVECSRNISFVPQIIWEQDIENREDSESGDPCLEDESFYSCGYFNEDTQKWSTEGCFTNNTGEKIQCSCSHFSDFALFYTSRFKPVSSEICLTTETPGSEIFVFTSVYMVAVCIFSFRMYFLTTTETIKRWIFVGLTSAALMRAIWTILFKFPDSPNAVLMILSLLIYLLLLLIESFEVLTWRSICNVAERVVPNMFVSSVKLRMGIITSFNLFFVSLLYLSVAIWPVSQRKSAYTFYFVTSIVFACSILCRSVFVFISARSFWSLLMSQFEQLKHSRKSGDNYQVATATKVLRCGLVSSSMLFGISVAAFLSIAFDRNLVIIKYVELMMEIILLFSLAAVYAPKEDERTRIRQACFPRIKHQLSVKSISAVEVSKERSKVPSLVDDQPSKVTNGTASIKLSTVTATPGSFVSRDPAESTGAVHLRSM